MQKQIGFSLIELMTVVAIIGILASIAVPSYQSYAKKAYFTEVITATAPYKIAIVLALQDGLSLNDCQAGQHGIPASIEHERGSIARLTVEHGTIVAMASRKAGSYSYILEPDETGNEWKISGTCINAGFCQG